MNNLLSKIIEIQKNNYGITIRKILIDDIFVYLLFITEIVNRQMVNENIIRSIINMNSSENLSIDFLVNKIICADDICIDDNTDLLLEYILNGNTVIAIPEEKKYIVINTKDIEKRNISSPEVESVLKGPKDCFSENFNTNISLIRYRIKDSELRIDKYIVGNRTKTCVGIIYIKDIANEKYVSEIKDKLTSIKVDGVLESGYIQKLLTNNSFSLFPKIGIAERSDSACAAILEGKICILVEGSNISLIAPKTFIEFSDSGDDHYDNDYSAILAKFIRFLSIIITLTLSSLYVALVGYNIDILPIKYALILSEARSRVPFPSYIEAFFTELLSEVLREASIRLPKQIGPAIGIVGTIVIGQAAVVAGLLSPLMVIIISITTMCSFVSPDITIINSIRILKFFVLFLTSILGMFGLSIGLSLIITALCSMESLGVSYTAPIVPFHWKDLKNYILSDINSSVERPHYLHNKDNKRR